MKTLGLSRYRLVPINISRLDLTHMVDCDSPEIARTTLSRLKSSLSRLQGGAFAVFPNSLYFNLSSKRKRCAIYHKYARDHRGGRSSKLPTRCLRLELTLRKSELADAWGNRDLQTHFFTHDFRNMFHEGFTGFRYAPNQHIANAYPKGMTDSKDRIVFNQWRCNAMDCYEYQTLRKHCRHFIAKYGINLMLPPSEFPVALVPQSLGFDDVMEVRRWCTNSPSAGEV
jgi:hypothetical protein